MEIPEEILKTPEKELKQILVEDPRKATYFTEGNYIYKVQSKVKGNVVIGDKIKGFRMYTMSYLTDRAATRFTPFTFIAYKEELDRNKYNNIGKLPTDKFVKYLSVAISNVKDKEFWSIETIDDGVVELVVYYPEITITNSIEMTHLMRDVYVKYHFYNDGNWGLDHVEIGRTAFTKREIKANYIFSHCTGGWNEGFTFDLCYGANTPISNLKNKLQYTLYNLSYFFVLFEQYLQWESIEGTPYRYIEHIYTTDRTFTPIDITTDVYKDLLAELTLYVLANINNFSYRYVFCNDVQTVVLDDRYISKIDELLTDKVQESLKYVRSNGISGGYIEQEIEDIDENQLSTITWKGETMPLRIIDDEPTITAKKEVHVDIRNAVIDKVTKIFEEFLITENI